MTTTYRLALIGFGNVGTGLAQIVAERGEQFRENLGLQVKLVAVSDLVKGSVYDPAGLEPRALLRAEQGRGGLEQLGAPFEGWDAQTTIVETNADVVVELTPTNLQTGEPALGHVRLALENGRHVVTTNKGPVALHFGELSTLARESGVRIGVEGTVLSGTPALRLGIESLAAAGITRIQGIFNGTCNYILTQMEQGAEYAEALRDAQARGYAEADPSGDVEGFDAAAKVVIMANLLMGTTLKLGDVSRQGITGLGRAEIHAARAAGERWKLIGNLERREGSVIGWVRPVRIPLEHPLAGIRGATNAVTYSTELLGDVTLAGPGAGRIETGFAVLSDIFGIHRTSVERGQSTKVTSGIT